MPHTDLHALAVRRSAVQGVDPQRARTALFPLLAVAALACCGGSQDTGPRAASDCGALSASASADALTSTAACLRASADGAERCRDAIDVAASAPPAALADLSACVMSSGERTDGVWLADMFAAAGEDNARLAAIASVFGDTFDVGLHGVTFTSSIDPQTQHALGRALGDVAPASRAALASLAISYSVDPLAGYCEAYAGELEGGDPALLLQAERIARADGPLDAEDGELLLNTGVWTAQEALLCARGDDPRCANWEGPSAAVILGDLEEVELGHPSAPATALQMIRTGTASDAEIVGLARFIGSAEYSNRDAILNALMLDLTDPAFPIGAREAIAEAATPAMCAYDQMRDYLLRAPTSDPQRFDNPDSPWPAFVRNCAERHWDVDTLMTALGAGSWLGVPRATYDTFVDRAQSAAGDVSCDEFRAIGRIAYDATRWVITRGAAHVVAARIAPDACADTMRAPVEAVATDNEEHPEARIAAYTWLLEQGDRSGCGQTERLLDWYHEDYRSGPGRWAEELGAELDAACN